MKMKFTFVNTLADHDYNPDEVTVTVEAESPDECSYRAWHMLEDEVGDAQSHDYLIGKGVEV